MLSDIQRQAIVTCLHGIDHHAQRHVDWPGPVLLAALRDTPVTGHPDPTARRVAVAPVPAPPDTWHHPDGPVAALHQVTHDLHHPVVQATVAIATATTDIRVLAWVFMYPVDGADQPAAPPVRVIEAVDLDDTTYTLTHRPDDPDGVVTVDHPGDEHGAHTALRALARTIRTR